MIRLVFLGKLADLAGGDAIDLTEATGAMAWAALLGRLAPPLAEALAADTTKVAVNGTVVADKAALVARNGDEIAFLPPVSGG